MFYPRHLVVVAVQHRGGTDDVVALAAAFAFAFAAVAAGGLVGVGEGDVVPWQLAQSNGVVGRGGDE